MAKRVIYGGGIVRHTIRIVDLDTGTELEAMNADDKLTAPTIEAAAAMQQNIAQALAQLREQHEGEQSEAPPQEEPRPLVRRGRPPKNVASNGASAEAPPVGVMTTAE